MRASLTQARPGTQMRQPALASASGGPGGVRARLIAPAGSALLASVLVRRPPAVAGGVPFAAGLALVDALATGKSRGEAGEQRGRHGV